MKIFGSYYQFFDFAQGNILGLKVAVVEFFRALCRYSTYDQIHLYVKDPAQFNKSREIIETLGIPVDQAKRLMISPGGRLPANLREFEYEVFFHGDPAIENLSYIRTMLCQEKVFPISCFVHDLSTSQLSEYFLRSYLADFYKFDTYICPSKAVKEVLSQHLKRTAEFLKQKVGKTLTFSPQMMVAPLGIDTEKFKPGQKEKFRSQLKLPAEKIIVLLEGRLTPFFKMDLFPYLQVIKRVGELTKNKNYLFVIVGQEQEPGYAEALKKLGHQLGLDSVLQIIDKFDNSLIPAYFGAADIFASPSDNIQETFGLTVLEGMSSGLPVVISDWNGYKESVTEGVDGFKIPTLWGKADTEISRISPVIASHMAPQFALAETVVINIEKMAQAFQKLIDNHNLRKKMGQAARSRILEKYSWKEVIKEYEKIWARNKRLQLNSRVKFSRDKIWPENIPFFNFYKHYPTDILVPQTRVKTTSVGQNYLETGKLLTGHDTISRLGNPETLKNIVEYCLNNYRPVADIWKNFKVRTPAEKEYFVFQILFMLKYNLLVVQEK